MSGKSSEYIQEQRFVSIFKNHEYKLYTLALQLTKSDQYAKDIVQEVFLKLWQERRNIYGSAQAEEWLYRLVENRIIRFLSRTAYDKRFRDALWVNMQSLASDKEEEVYAATVEYNTVIEKAISHLAPQRRRIYQLNNESYLNHNWVFAEDQKDHSSSTYLGKIINKIRHLFS